MHSGIEFALALRGLLFCTWHCYRQYNQKAGGNEHEDCVYLVVRHLCMLRHKMFSSFAAAWSVLSDQEQKHDIFGNGGGVEVDVSSYKNKRMKLIEIGIESVKLVEIAGLIEQTFDVPVNEGCDAVQDILDYAKKQ